MERYNPQVIEKKWQMVWERAKAHNASFDYSKKKFNFLIDGKIQHKNY